jgi:uncharacterized protein (DUF983 family)
MFPPGTLYTSKFMEMYQRCSCCDQSFMPEPGYYFGAMFVSYGLNAAYIIAAWLAIYVLLPQTSVWILIAIIVGLIIGLLPVTFRLSRVLWIYIFVKYRGPVECESGTRTQNQ